MHADIYIATTTRGPAKRDGMALYVIDTGEWQKKRKAEIHKVNEQGAEAILLYAALKKLFQAFPKGIEAIDIYASSPSTSNALNGWLEKWEASDWKNSKGTPVANADEWKNIHELTKDIEITVHINEEHSYSLWINMELQKPMQ